MLLGARIAITGAGGIVGRATRDALARVGYDVVPIMSPAYRGDERDVVIADLTQTFPDIGKFTHLVHLAAALPHDRRYRTDSSSGRLTRSIDQNAFTAARKYSARVIYASTCSLYDPTCPIEKKEEETNLRIDSDYRSSKRHGELDALQMGGVVLRLAAPYGPGIFLSTVLAKFIEDARSGKSLDVWGGGTREQNFVHSRDIASCIRKICGEQASGIFNIAAQPIRMRELGELVVRLCGAGALRMGLYPDPLEGQFARYSAEKALRCLGWRPTVDLATGVAECLNEEFRI